MLNRSDNMGEEQEVVELTEVEERKAKVISEGIEGRSTRCQSGFRCRPTLHFVENATPRRRVQSVSAYAGNVGVGSAGRTFVEFFPSTDSQHQEMPI